MIVIMPLSGEPAIDGLLSGFGWWDGAGPVTFGFPTVADDVADYLALGLSEPIGFQPLSGPGLAAGSAVGAALRAFA